MAGVKGRSGGPRANSGGARPNSGPKPKPAVKRRVKSLETQDPDEFLRQVMADSNADFKDRMAAALALKKTTRAGVPMGKKDQKQADAEGIVRGPLAPLPAPTKARPLLRSVK